LTATPKNKGMKSHQHDNLLRILRTLLSTQYFLGRV
jgi:hypothetical protein